MSGSREILGEKSKRGKNIEEERGSRCKASLPVQQRHPLDAS